MAGEETQKIIDQYPKIGEASSDNYAGIPDIWGRPNCGDVHEPVVEYYCPQEDADSVKTNPCPRLPLSEWPWVITVYALVIVPFAAAVVGIHFWARQSLDRFAVIALTSFVAIFVVVPAILAMWDWLKPKAP